MPPSYVYTWITSAQFVDYLAYIAIDSAYPAAKIWPQKAPVQL
jgi:hypothetical protein